MTDITSSLEKTMQENECSVLVALLLLMDKTIEKESNYANQSVSKQLQQPVSKYVQPVSE